MKELKKLKKEIEKIDISYDYEETYTNLLNATIDYQNETQDWCFEYVFEDYCDEYLIEEMVKYKIEKEGLWSVQNLLSGIDRYEGIYYIDAYGYGHDIDKEDLEYIKEQILDIIKEKMENK